MFVRHLLQDILHLTESNIKDMGVKNSAHRAKISSSLVILREKFHGRKYRVYEIDGFLVAWSKSAYMY